MISETGSETTISRDINGKNAAALMGGTDAQAIGTAWNAHGTLDVHLLPFLVMHFEGHPTTGTGDEMATLGIEIHLQRLLQFFLDAGLGAADDIFLRIVAGRVGALINGDNAAIDGAELAEEVARHLTVVEVLTVLAAIRVLGHPEIKHPTGVSTQFVIARVE